MHYDDIANNKQNKYPEKVYNGPTGHNGTDVYHGVPKHYTGKEVTPENFLKVLAGDEGLKKAGKKVLESGPNDHVFIFFDDHGAPDLVAFPDKYLYAEPLMKTLKQMHQDKKYSKLVFYIEACESGSMFDKLLPTDINIYATTASLPNEPSYTCYFDKDLGTDVGDVYSVYWMENTELATKDTTLQEQFAYTKKKTTTSHVMQYGDLSIAKLPISQFLGSKKSSMSLAGAELTRTVNNKDFPLVMAQQSGDYHKLSELSTGRQFLDTVFEEYVNSIQ
ncbi:unnamed protein product, partial [Medioppia subpectinata]